jgi:hypothetical protein
MWGGHSCPPLLNLIFAEPQDLHYAGNADVASYVSTRASLPL